MVANDCLDLVAEVSEGELREGKDSSSRIGVFVFLVPFPSLAKREEEVVGSVVNKDVISLDGCSTSLGIGVE